MHLASFTITNLKGLSKISWAPAQPAGWHVIIGDNGAGKSSILRAVSLLLLGLEQARLLRHEAARLLSILHVTAHAIRHAATSKAKLGPKASQTTAKVAGRGGRYSRLRS